MHAVLGPWVCTHPAAWMRHDLLAGTPDPKHGSVPGGPGPGRRRCLLPDPGPGWVLSTFPRPWVPVGEQGGQSSVASCCGLACCSLLLTLLNACVCTF